MIRNHYDYIDARYYAIKQGKELKDLTAEEMEMFRVQAKSIPVSNIQKWEEELKKDIKWNISGVTYLVKNVPYLYLDEEEFFDTDISIKLEVIRNLMLDNEIPNVLDFNRVADIEF